MDATLRAESLRRATALESRGHSIKAELPRVRGARCARGSCAAAPAGTRTPKCAVLKRKCKTGV
jgi:hypothetical protein